MDEDEEVDREGGGWKMSGRVSFVTRYPIVSD